MPAPAVVGAVPLGAGLPANAKVNSPAYSRVNPFSQGLADQRGM